MNTLGPLRRCSLFWLFGAQGAERGRDGGIGGTFHVSIPFGKPVTSMLDDRTRRICSPCAAALLLRCVPVPPPAPVTSVTPAYPISPLYLLNLVHLRIQYTQARHNTAP